MGQKTNPTILRLGVKKTYNYQHIEKKLPERSFYDFKILEIYYFVYKFFRDNNLIIQNCKINYSNNETLHVFISYFANVQMANIKKNYSLVSDLKNVKSEKKYNIYNLIHYIKLFVSKKNFDFKNHKELKFRLRNQYIKNIKLLSENSSVKQFDKTFFLNSFLESLYIFVGKNVTIHLTIKQLNKSLKKKINQNDLKLIKKSLIKINRYKQNDFFKEGVNIVFLCCQQPTSSKLLASFLADQLQKTKRHNFFLKFITKCLKTFKSTANSKLKGIQIKVTGRINRVPMAKHKIIKIGSNLPIISVSSNISYSEKTAYTSNGTLGVKVWLFY